MSTFKEFVVQMDKHCFQWPRVFVSGMIRNWKHASRKWWEKCL